GHWAVGHAHRWADTPGEADDVVGAGQLLAHGLARERGQIGMAPRVVADAVPALAHLIDQIRSPGGLLADLEEGRGGVVGAEQVQDPWRPGRAGSVVEAEVEDIPGLGHRHNQLSHRAASPARWG